ncbi:MAG: fibronectin type III domain-containing protein [Anaerolineae bacterium]|nr:fibronectin type III domain-containing protein [Anaerolineae bacterium]
MKIGHIHIVKLMFVLGLLLASTNIAGAVQEIPPSVYNAVPNTSLSPADYPPDPTANIAWNGDKSTVADIQAAFNYARTVENTQLGTSIPMMTLPGQTEWDGMNDGEKALWLINRDRVDRGVHPLHSTEVNVTHVAQTYAQYLFDHDAWGHYEDGNSPWQRLDNNAAIGACHDSLNVAENIAAFVTSGSSIPLPIERSVYNWMYDDSGSNWGHRHAILWYPYNDNSGITGKEGFLGIGRANGGPYQGPFSQSWNYVELIVMNVFDPCATWEYVTPTPPTAPGNLAVSLTSQTAITLTWTDNSDNEDGFKIERSPDGSSDWTQVGTVAADMTTYADTGLPCETPYDYRVVAYNTDGTSAYSNVAHGTTTACPLSAPAAPSDLTVLLTAQTAITLTWTDNSDNEEGFKIERSPDGGSDWTQVGTVITDVTTYTDTGLTCETPYYYRVLAYNAAGDSAYSNVVNTTTATCPPTAPAAPENLTVTLTSQTAMTLTWTDNSDNEDGFKIERSSNGNVNWAQAGTVMTDVTTYADTDLTCETVYYYRTLAYNSTGDSAYSNVVSGTTTTCPTYTPAPPSDLSITPISQTAIVLTWRDNSDNEDGFRIERSSDGAKGRVQHNKRITKVADWVQVGTVMTNVTVYTDTNLTENTTYAYRVYAFNAFGDSDASHVIQDTTYAVLAVTKVVDTGGLTEVPLGGIVTYTIVITNNSTEIAPNVVLTDPLPAEVLFKTFVDYGNSAVLPPPGTVNLPPAAVVWEPGNVAPGESLRLSFVVAVTENTDAAGSTVVNTAFASADNASQVSGGDSFTIKRDEYALYLPLILRSYPEKPLDLKSLITRVSITLPHSLGGRDSSWCTWNWCYISPRLYHAPWSANRTLVGWTDANGNGYVSVIGAEGVLEQTYDFAGRSVRGLFAHNDAPSPDGNVFAVLLWDPDAKIMWLSKRNPDGSEIWTTNIDGELTSFNPNIGDSRLTYGNNTYAAYFAVHGDSGWPEGHEGDQLRYISGDGTIQSGGWDWGCSHSMAELVSYHPTLDAFAPVCSSDCYASKGILINDSKVVYACDGNCGGLVSAQLGQIALSQNTWKMVFNALEQSGYESKGIGFVTIESTFQSTYVWLTDTDGEYERDPVLGRLGTTLDSDRYLAGWTTTNDGVYWLSVVDGSGNFIVDPEEVSSTHVAWGNRDDSFRTRPDGQVSWVQGEPNSNILNLFIFDGAVYIP